MGIGIHELANWKELIINPWVPELKGTAKYEFPEKTYRKHKGNMFPFFFHKLCDFSIVCLFWAMFSKLVADLKKY